VDLALMKSIVELIFVTTCGSDEENKDTTFGYENVFKEVKALAGNKLVFAEALSIKLLSPKTKPLSDEEMMNIRLSDTVFCNEIEKRFHQMVEKL